MDRTPSFFHLSPSVPHVRHTRLQRIPRLLQRPLTRLPVFDFVELPLHIWLFMTLSAHFPGQDKFNAEPHENIHGGQGASNKILVGANV